MATQKGKGRIFEKAGAKMGPADTDRERSTALAGKFPSGKRETRSHFQKQLVFYLSRTGG